MKSAATSSIPGQIEQSGAVRCECGKKVGDITDTGVEFWCRNCNRVVEVEFTRMKAQGLLTAIGGINAATAAIASGMATLERLTTQLATLPA